MYKILLHLTLLASAIRTPLFVSAVPTYTRNLSIITSPKVYEWLCILPDVPGAHEKRLQTRPLHLAGVQKLVDEGFITWGGAALNDIPADDNDAKTYSFYGTVMTAVAASKEEVVGQLKEDPYAKAGVWDMEKAQIMPYKCAVRVPLKK